MGLTEGARFEKLTALWGNWNPSLFHWLVLMVVVGGGLTLRLGSSTAGLPLDDSWIHLVYARSLAEHFTFGYAPGGWENGSTAPLWTVMESIPLFLGASPVVAAKTVGIAAYLALIVACSRLAFRLGGAVAGGVAAMVVACDPWTSVLAVSGMEPVAAMLAAVLAMYAYLEGRFWLTGIALAAAGVLRPELGVLTVLVCIAALLHWLVAFLRAETPKRQVLREALSRLGAIAVPPVLVGMAWFQYGHSTTGYIFPNTFLVKVSPNVDPLHQLEVLGALFLEGPLYAVLPVLVLMALGGWRLIRSYPVFAPVLLITPFVILGFHIRFHSLGEDYGYLSPGSVQNLYMARYPLIVIPWIVLWFSIGVAQGYEILQQWFGKRRSAIAIIGVLVLIATVWLPHRSLLSRAYAANCREIDEVQVALGHWVNQNLPKDAVVGVSDAGAIRYYAEQNIVDLVGLNNHKLIRAFQTGDLDSWLVEQRITHFVIWPQWHREIVTASQPLEKVKSVRIENPTIVPAKEMVVVEVVRPGR